MSRLSVLVASPLINFWIRYCANWTPARLHVSSHIIFRMEPWSEEGLVGWLAWTLLCLFASKVALASLWAVFPCAQPVCCVWSLQRVLGCYLLGRGPSVFLLWLSAAEKQLNAPPREPTVLHTSPVLISATATMISNTRRANVSPLPMSDGYYLLFTGRFHVMKQNNVVNRSRKEYIWTETFQCLKFFKEQEKVSLRVHTH